ncbi:MAG: hypothetical protein L0H73_07155 [Nitrococcus sp.]|nr:hypothetical protein [Nitrococcus sp.]
MTTNQLVTAQEVLDSGGNPTVEALVRLEDGTTGTAIVPSGASTGEKEARLRSPNPSAWDEETFHALKALLHRKGYGTGVGDEGGFAPDLRSDEEAVEVILEAIVHAGYQPGNDISLCLDPASSEPWHERQYAFSKSKQLAKSAEEMIRLYESWVRQYPIVLLEDGLAENDWDGWQALTAALGEKLKLVGDDIFCTNAAILAKGIAAGVAKAVLIKLKQIGTLTETLDTVDLAQRNNYNCFVSHRSGETEDTIIADLTVAIGAGHLKTGSGCRSERVAKFNQLLRIERQLGSATRFAGKAAFKHAQP